jgi:hypothetical protein
MRAKQQPEKCKPKPSHSNVINQTRNKRDTNFNLITTHHEENLV